MESHVDLKDEEQKQLFKEVLKEAIDEWLDKQYVRVGKWSVAGVLALATGALSYFYLTSHGYKP